MGHRLLIDLPRPTKADYPPRALNTRAHHKNLIRCIGRYRFGSTQCVGNAEMVSDRSFSSELELFARPNPASI
jgi:hypothetical protein